MAKITSQVCRKIVKCSKCGRLIEVGEKYLKATPYRRLPIIRCAECGLKSYETSGSDYVRQVGGIVEDWERNYEICDGTAEAIADDLQLILDECQERLENMPEQLQETSPLQDRIDCLESVINDLGDCDWDECMSEAGDEDEGRNLYIDSINDYLSGLEY